MAAANSQEHQNVPGVTTFEDLIQNENVNKPIDIYILISHEVILFCICYSQCIVKIDFLPGLVVHTCYLRRVRQEDHDSEANLNDIARLV